MYNVTELILNRENIFEFLCCIRFLSHCDLPLCLMSRSNKFIFYFKFVSLDLGCVFLRYYSASFAHSIPVLEQFFFSKKCSVLDLPSVRSTIFFRSDFPYMPTLERLKAVGGLGFATPAPPPENCFSEGRKMVHSVAFWI